MSSPLPPLRAIRKQRGMTVEQLAVAAGLVSATVYRVERGEHQPTDDTIAALAAALGVPVADLTHTPEPDGSTDGVGKSETPETNPTPADASQRSPAGV